MTERAAPKLRNIAVAGRELALAWGDGHESYIPFDLLRRSCPCAFCTTKKEKGSEKEKGSDPFFTTEGHRTHERTPVVKKGSDPFIAGLVPVGGYAVQVGWSDGHDTGIYSFEMLRRLCPCAECAGSQ